MDSNDIKYNKYMECISILHNICKGMSNILDNMHNYISHILDMGILMVGSSILCKLYINIHDNIMTFLFFIKIKISYLPSRLS